MSTAPKSIFGKQPVSQPDFTSFGLITCEKLKIAYDLAKTNAEEHATVHLWEDLFNDDRSPIYIGRDSSCHSQYRPSEKSGKKCDLAITYVDHQTRTKSVLLLMECKRPSRGLESELRKAEEQCEEYCKLYVKDKKVPYVYGGTSFGTYVRLFKHEQGSFLSMWGESTRGDADEYKDIGEASQARLVRDALRHMHAFPPTLSAGQTTSSYGARQIAAPIIRGTVELHRKKKHQAFYFEFEHAGVTMTDPVSAWKVRDEWLVNDDRNLQGREVVDVKPEGQNLKITSGLHEGKVTTRKIWSVVENSEKKSSDGIRRIIYCSQLKVMAHIFSPAS